MNVIAMYLPQFHRVKENDEWWGEGFTEWTAVKKAQPLYTGHNQPRVPLNGNYYNLLDKCTMQWQSELMQQYGVFGMCFYHYWFKDGRRILEKPAEHLLEWKDIDMPFCFSWANESWTRTWSKLNDRNTWASKFETSNMQGKDDNGILLEQKYGAEEDWLLHFNYLLPFFHDKRYIKIDNKPVFIFYKPSSIPCLSKMIDYWNELAVENGLKGIYFIGSNLHEKGALDAVMYQEPQFTIKQNFDVKFDSNQNKVEKCIPYSEIWKKITERDIDSEYKIFLGGFTGYDDSPRRSAGGIVVENSTPDVFEENLKKLLKKSQALKNEYVFINAWNEWGEGMYLEPDERNQYEFLEAVKNALETYEDTKLPDKVRDSFSQEQIKGLQRVNQRYESYWKLLNKWLGLKEDGIKLQDYLLGKNIHNIAIYGIGMMGVHLTKEFEGGDIQILYGIDQKGDTIHMNFPIYRMEDELPDVDAVIISVTYDFEAIYHLLRSRIKCPIISLKEIVEES